MNDSYRVKSIARRIGNSWLFRTFWMMLLLNIFATLLLSAAGIFGWEKYVAEDWQPTMSRSFVRHDVNDSFPLSGLEYEIIEISGKTHTLDLSESARQYFPFAATMGAIELFLFIIMIPGAHRRARRFLKPLDKMARDMKNVSRLQNQANRYEDRLHDLEEAIVGISPNQPEAKLRTGAEELTGLEKAINDLLVRMHESYRQQAQFVSDASHELRTPIAVIQGYANMLARWGKNDEKVLEESIAAIQSESDYMKKLVEELLFLARGEIGRNPYEPENLSLTVLIEEAREESAMIDPAHNWVSKSADEEVRVFADGEMIKQCVRILCENARKYTPEGGTIKLSVYATEDGWSQFQVQDEGIGISEADAPHIFDRFYRSDPARGRNSGGTGLGLAIAKWIVDRHGGYFELLSREELGTRITVSLPDRQK